MNDFTTIELNPIPPDIADLQFSNEKLNSKNQLLSGLLFAFAFLGVSGNLFLLYYKSTKENEGNARIMGGSRK
jgi:hypothetical protein